MRICFHTALNRALLQVQVYIMYPACAPGRAIKLSQQVILADCAYAGHHWQMALDQLTSYAL